MQRRTQFAILGGLLAIATALGIAVFSRHTAAIRAERALTLASDSLALDLALSSSNRTQIVSALERNDAETAPAPAPMSKSRAPVRARTRATPIPKPSPRHVPEPAAVEVAEAPEAVSAPMEETTTAPSPVPAEVTPSPASSPSPLPLPAPAPSRGRRGGWWTTADVIRNAPFPINP